MDGRANRPSRLGKLRVIGTLMTGAYVLINLILYGLASFAPRTAEWPTWAVTALAVPPMVLGMVYLVMPLAQRQLSR